MAVVQSAGTKLFIGGTGALASEATWVEVGEITSFSEFGRSYQLVTHEPVGDRKTYKFKGGRNDGAIQLDMARVPDDDGQTAIRTALDSDDKYNIKIELDDNPDEAGDGTPTTFTFKGLVMSYGTNIGSRNGIVAARVAIEIDGDITEEAADAGVA